MGNGFFASFVSTVLVAGSLAFALALLTSEFTTVGHKFQLLLAEPLPGILGGKIQKGALAIALSVVAVGFFTDVLKWRGRCGQAARLVCLFLGLSVAFLGILFTTPTVPSIPLILGMFIIGAVVFIMNQMVFSDVPTDIRERGSALGQLFLGVLLGVGWLLWLSSPSGFLFEDAYGDEAQERLSGEREGLSMEAGFILWCSPALMSLFFIIGAAFSASRGHFHRQNAKAEHGPIVFGPELQVCIVVLALAALGAWIAASMSARDVELSKIVLRLSAAIGLFVCIYITQWIGLERLRELAETNSTLQLVVGLVVSDWAKGLLVLVALPFAPLLFVVDFMHQEVRRCFVGCGVLDRVGYHSGILTYEMTCIVQEARKWEWSSIFRKSMMCGIAIFGVQVCVSQGLVVFLAWFNEKMEPYDLSICLVLLFVVEIMLFLFPPVAGPPLYMIAAIVIIPKIGYEESEFVLGIIFSSCFCLFLKLVAIALEQKAIGKPFSQNLKIKKFIGVHTPFMRAIRHILSQPGFSPGKVAVLVGGPDWPTSVITGILDLPLCSMLMGSLPVAILITPCCVAAGFMLKAGVDTENEAQLSAMANVFVVLAAVATGIANIAVAYFIQSTLATYKDEIADEKSDWQRDPQEAEVKAAILRDERQAARAAYLTRWIVTPNWVRVCLVVGSLLTTAACYVLIQPVRKPFEKFKINDRVSELPGGSPLSVVNDAGWVSIGIMCGACVCLAIVMLWVRQAVAAGGPGDAELDEESMAESVVPQLRDDTGKASPTEERIAPQVRAEAAVSSSPSEASKGGCLATAASPREEDLPPEVLFEGTLSNPLRRHLRGHEGSATLASLE